MHIADPSRWVDFSDPLDVEAARRSKSTYLPTGGLFLGKDFGVMWRQHCDDTSFRFAAMPVPACAPPYPPPAVGMASMCPSALQPFNLRAGAVRSHPSLDFVPPGNHPNIPPAAGMVPMFPHALAEGPFSLRAGAAPGAAMSLGVLLGPDGGIKDYVVTPSLVAPAERLTYHQADARLDDGNLAQKDAAFHALAEVGLRVFLAVVSLICSDFE